MLCDSQWCLLEWQKLPSCWCWSSWGGEFGWPSPCSGRPAGMNSKDRRSFRNRSLKVIQMMSLWFLSCCRAISHIMSTLFYPVITFLLLTVCISYWTVTAVYPSEESDLHVIWVSLLSKICVCEALQYPDNRKSLTF